jgi:hypothetical protein
MLTGFWFEKEVLKFEPLLRVRVGVVLMAVLWLASPYKSDMVYF